MWQVSEVTKEVSGRSLRSQRKSVAVVLSHKGSLWKISEVTLELETGVKRVKRVVRRSCRTIR